MMPLAAGAAVKFRADSVYAKHHPGQHIVEGLASENGDAVYLAGHVLRFPSKDLEMATTAASDKRSLARPAVVAPAFTTAASPAASLGAHSPRAETASPATEPAKAPEGDDAWAAEYRNSPALQREFFSEESYVALKKHEARKAGIQVQTSAAEIAKQDDPHAAEWMRSPELQREFLTAQSYSAFKRAEAQGRFGVHRGRVA